MESIKEEMRMADLLFGEEQEGDDLEKLNLTQKTRRCLSLAGITTLIEVFDLDMKKMSQIPHMNKAMANEVVEKVAIFLKNSARELFKDIQ